MHQRLDYLLRRLAFSVVTLVAVITFNFFLFRIIPGDPVQMMVSPMMTKETRDNIRQVYGLDKPLWLNVEAFQEEGEFERLFDSQFAYYIRNLLKGELGMSFRQRVPVSEILGNRVGPSLLLILSGEVLGILFGTFLGLVAAWKKKSMIDASTMFVSLTVWALPPFWLGIIMLILSRGHLPMGGFVTPGTIYASNWEKILDIGTHVILPATTLALMLVGAYVLIVRNTTLEVLAEDYTLTAKAKGLTPLQVLRFHALRNASLPLVTIIAMDLGYALGGTIQIETIFSYPGLGRLMFESIGQRDYPVLQAVFLILAVVVISANFFADLTYTFLDPRIKS
ncbi:MAG: ABC transporter permease [Anaerolineales bacterium]|nr:ABC transporter permease [Anaerolineales bacterium]